MESAVVGCSLETFTFPTQDGLRGQGSGELLLGEGGEIIAPE